MNRAEIIIINIACGGWLVFSGEDKDDLEQRHISIRSEDFDGRIIFKFILAIGFKFFNGYFCICFDR